MDSRPAPSYVYRSSLVRVVDGDTIVLNISLGCHVYRTTTVRLLGVNTPEKIGATAAAGRLAAHWAASWLTDSPQGEWPLVAETVLDRSDKYGRLLCTIWRVSDGACLNQDLLSSGHAVPYEGGQR